MKKLLILLVAMSFYGTNVFAMEDRVIEFENGSGTYSFQCSMKINDQQVRELDLSPRQTKVMELEPDLFSEGNIVHIAVWATNMQNATYPEKLTQWITFAPIRNVEGALDYFNRLKFYCGVLEPAAAVTLVLDVILDETYPSLEEKLRTFPILDKVSGSLVKQQVMQKTKKENWISTGLRRIQ